VPQPRIVEGSFSQCERRIPNLSGQHRVPRLLHVAGKAFSNMASLFAGVYNFACKGFGVFTALPQAEPLPLSPTLFRCSGTCYGEPQEEDEPRMALTGQGSATIELRRLTGPQYFLRVTDTARGNDLMDAPISSLHMQCFPPTMSWCFISAKPSSFGFRVVGSEDHPNMTPESISVTFIRMYWQLVEHEMAEFPVNRRLPHPHDDQDDVMKSTKCSMIPRKSPNQCDIVTPNGEVKPDLERTTSPLSEPFVGRRSKTETTNDGGSMYVPPASFSFQGRKAEDCAAEEHRPTGRRNAWLKIDAANQRLLVAKEGGAMEFYKHPDATAGLHPTPVTVMITGSSQEFTRPKDVVLLYGGGAAAMLARAGATAVTRVDLETGTAEDYSARFPTSSRPDSGYPLNNLSLYNGHDASAAPSLLAVSNSHACFAFDMRMNPGACAVLKRGETLQDLTHCTRNPQHLHCHATSAAGHLVVGDHRGFLHLFSGPPGSVRANGKWHHPGIATSTVKATAEPIFHVDVTGDGRYVLATCRQHLLVLCAVVPRSSYLGFEKSMDYGNPPRPLRLDVPAKARCSSDFTLSKATFSYPESPSGAVITTSVGSCLLVWEMRHVRKAIDTGEAVRCRVMDKHVPLQLVSGSGDRVAYMSDDRIGWELLWNHPISDDDDDDEYSRSADTA
jgi:hypothetical protein